MAPTLNCSMARRARSRSAADSLDSVVAVTTGAAGLSLVGVAATGVAVVVVGGAGVALVAATGLVGTAALVEAGVAVVVVRGGGVVGVLEGAACAVVIQRSELNAGVATHRFSIVLRR